MGVGGNFCVECNEVKEKNCLINKVIGKYEDFLEVIWDFVSYFCYYWESFVSFF